MNRIALVTGAGSGIGRAASLALATAGFLVVIGARRLERLESNISMAGEGARMVARSIQYSKSAPD